MTSDQAVQFATFLGALRARFSNADLDLPTVRDIVETMHVATKEPEGVSYAEEDAGGAEALWCIPVDSDPDAVLLHIHLGGTVVASMYSDRNAAAHMVVVVLAIGWLFARAKHAREALKAVRDAEAARASVQRTSSPTAG